MRILRLLSRHNYGAEVLTYLAIAKEDQLYSRSEIEKQALFTSVARISKQTSRPRVLQ
jgi:hypothetical protein